MPEITKYPVTVDVDISFEVFCGRCGAGLCNSTNVKGHQYPQLHVDLCPNCEDELKTEIKYLKSDLEREKDENYTLRNEIKQLQKQIAECLKDE